MPNCKRCADNGDLGKVCPHYGPETHDILMDLIKELRDEHVCECWGKCVVETAAYRAEQRLKEVTNE